jgi:siroheme synthase (precorrin-2 oxidase/ferrochelatase)
MNPRSGGLPVSLDVAGRRVVVVGRAPEKDDDELQRRLELLAACGAEVIRVTEPPLPPDLLDGVRLAMVTEPGGALAEAAIAEARARGVLLWVCDRPEVSDLILPAVARLGPARIAVSTGGRSPSLARRLRERFEKALGPEFGRFVVALGERRTASVGQPDPAARRQHARAALDGFEVEVNVHYPGWFTRPRS